MRNSLSSPLRELHPTKAIAHFILISFIIQVGTGYNGQHRSMGPSTEDIKRLNERLHERDSNADKFKMPCKRCCLPLLLSGTIDILYFLMVSSHSNHVNISLLLVADDEYGDQNSSAGEIRMLKLVEHEHKTQRIGPTNPAERILSL